MQRTTEPVLYFLDASALVHLAKSLSQERRPPAPVSEQSAMTTTPLSVAAAMQALKEQRRTDPVYRRSFSDEYFAMLRVIFSNESGLHVELIDPMLDDRDTCESVINLSRAYELSTSEAIQTIALQSLNARNGPPGVALLTTREGPMTAAARDLGISVCCLT